MNLGLGTLNELKLQLLASALQGDTKYDERLKAIGSGVARQFEKHCNRIFFRTAGDRFQLPADRDHCFVPRYPLDANEDGSPAISLVEYRPTIQDGWITQAMTTIANVSPASGGIYFVSPFGYWFEFVRITYTGGYWFDETEDKSGTQPDGSTFLPEDLKLAWYLQCRRNWEAIDKQGKDVTKTGGSASSPSEGLTQLELVPAVKQVLDSYKRFAVT